MLWITWLIFYFFLTKKFHQSKIGKNLIASQLTIYYLDILNKTTPVCSSVERQNAFYLTIHNKVKHQSWRCTVNSKYSSTIYMLNMFVIPRKLDFISLTYSNEKIVFFKWRRWSSCEWLSNLNMSTGVILILILCQTFEALKFNYVWKSNWNRLSYLF